MPSPNHGVPPNVFSKDNTGPPYAISEGTYVTICAVSRVLIKETAYATGVCYHMFDQDSGPQSTSSVFISASSSGGSVW